MRHYYQLTEGQRYQIEALMKAGKTQKAIAVILGVSPATISRELKRNKGHHGYRPKQAHNKAHKRRKNAAKTKKMTADVIAHIEGKLRLEWSPE